MEIREDNSHKKICLDCIYDEVILVTNHENVSAFLTSIRTLTDHLLWATAFGCVYTTLIKIFFRALQQGSMAYIPHCLFYIAILLAKLRDIAKTNLLKLHCDDRVL